MTKSEGNPKGEFRAAHFLGAPASLPARPLVSDFFSFGLLSDFGLRISDFS